MAFLPFKKTKCLITDELFIKITWEDGKSPDDDSELLGIIEGVDQVNMDQFPFPIEDTLPYLNFYQAENLFQALKETYGSFRLKEVAITHLEAKEAVTEGEVFASPFIIDGSYQNLLLPLIESILKNPAFANYSYQEKREYFENQLYPIYKDSLGVSDSSLPIFPVEGERLSGVSQEISKTRHPSPPRETSKVKPQSVKGISILAGISILLAAIGLGLTILVFGRLSQKTEQVNYLYQEVKNLNKLTSTEHKIDVFGRYFLSTYYSGNKEQLTAYLSDGDAKYTVPKKGLCNRLF